MHEGGGRWVGSNKVVELKRKNTMYSVELPVLNSRSLLIIYFIYFAKLFQSCPTLCGPMSPAGSSVHGFCRQEKRSGLPCPSPGDLPDPGIEPPPLMFPALAGEFFTTSTTWEVHFIYHSVYVHLNLPIYPSPLPHGSHKFVFYICDSISVL